MDNLERRPARMTQADLGAHRARVFVGQRCKLGPTLVVPLWTLWQEYRSFGERNGFEAQATDLRLALDAAAWAEVMERPNARGRLKTIVLGVGLLPTAPESQVQA